MVAIRGLVSLVTVVLVLQGVVAFAPHDHGTPCIDGPAFELQGGFDAPHHCLACSIHVPAAAMVAAAAAVWSETGASPIAIARAIHVFAAAVESFRPRGPPRVV